MTLRWTNQDPLKPGWYWYRPEPNGAIEVVWIYEHMDGGLLLGRINEQYPENLNDAHGEWVGPLDEPS